MFYAKRGTLCFSYCIQIHEPFTDISTMYVVGELNDVVDVTSVKLELYKIKDNDSLDKLIF